LHLRHRQVGAKAPFARRALAATGKPCKAMNPVAAE
jgi:hypothetical protein